MTTSWALPPYWVALSLVGGPREVKDKKMLKQLKHWEVSYREWNSQLYTGEAQSGSWPSSSLKSYRRISQSSSAMSQLLYSLVFHYFLSSLSSFFITKWSESLYCFWHHPLSFCRSGFMHDSSSYTDIFDQSHVFRTVFTVRLTYGSYLELPSKDKVDKGHWVSIFHFFPSFSIWVSSAIFPVCPRPPEMVFNMLLSACSAAMSWVRYGNS